MTRSRNGALCRALLALLTATAVPATDNARPASNLPPGNHALQALAVAACGTGAAAFEFTVEGKDAARLLCPSVERVANTAVRLRHACQRREGQWRCEPVGKEFSLPVNGRQVSVLYPVALDSFAAWQMARAVMPMTVPLAQASPTAAVDHCRLFGDFSDLKVARMTLRCENWTVEFVRLCDSNGCRHVPASRISNADSMKPGQRAQRPPRR